MMKLWMLAILYTTYAGVNRFLGSLQLTFLFCKIK